jgi:hypothetical protein
MGKKIKAGKCTMSYFEEQYKEYNEFTTGFLKKELENEEHFLRVESIETDISALHECAYCRLRISAIKKLLEERDKDYNEKRNKTKGI